MPTVYAIEYHDYDLVGTIGIFSTPSKAEEALATFKQTTFVFRSICDIVEYELDELIQEYRP